VTDKAVVVAVVPLVLVGWFFVAVNVNYALDKPLDIVKEQNERLAVSCVSCSVPGHFFFTPVYGIVATVNAQSTLVDWAVGVFETVILRGQPDTANRKTG
jgi:hypothetical protein